MPQIISSSQKAIPSTQRSKAVFEVLDRIHVRDPHHPSNEVYGRRISDYEIHSLAMQTVVLFTAAALLTAVLWSTLSQKIPRMWDVYSVQQTAQQQTSEELNVPSGVHPAPLGNAQSNGQDNGF